MRHALALTQPRSSPHFLPKATSDQEFGICCLLRRDTEWEIDGNRIIHTDSGIFVEAKDDQEMWHAGINETRLFNIRNSTIRDLTRKICAAALVDDITKFDVLLKMKVSDEYAQREADRAEQARRHRRAVDAEIREEEEWAAKMAERRNRKKWWHL